MSETPRCINFSNKSHLEKSEDDVKNIDPLNSLLASLWKLPDFCLCKIIFVGDFDQILSVGSESIPVIPNNTST